MIFSDNGREFDNKVIKELLAKWKECRLVHGKPRHSQSQGSVERANQDVRNMLISWMKTENRTDWSEGLDDVQINKNRSLHKGIARSPYEAMFGKKAEIGISTSALPQEILEKIETEEQLEEALKQLEGKSEADDEENEATAEKSVALNLHDSNEELIVSDNILDQDDDNDDDSEFAVSAKIHK